MYFKTVVNGKVQGVFYSTQDFSSDITSEITKEEHDKLSKEINDKSRADREALELSRKPQQEYEAKINAELRAMAEERIAAKEIIK